MCSKVGEVYCWMGEYEAAVDHQKKYLKMSLEEKDLVEEQRAYTTLGRTCYIQVPHLHYLLQKSQAHNLPRILRQFQSPCSLLVFR